MTFDLGLTSRDLDTVTAIFRKYPGIERVRVFGSRAKGNHRRGSDIDLAVEGKYEMFRLRDDFEESSLPYLIDIIDPRTCTSNDLREHIDRVGKVVYERK